MQNSSKIHCFVINNHFDHEFEYRAYLSDLRDLGRIRDHSFGYFEIYVRTALFICQGRHGQAYVVLAQNFRKDLYVVLLHE